MKSALFHITTPLGRTTPAALRGAFGHYVLQLYRTGGIPAGHAQLFTNKDFNTQKPIEGYAKIQFRWLRGGHHIWTMNEGVDALRMLLGGGPLNNFELNGSVIPELLIEETEYAENHVPESTLHRYEYSIQGFIPFNQEKAKQYQGAEGMLEKVGLIEQILLNELVLFSYAANWNLGGHILQPKILNIDPRKDFIYTTNDKGSGKKITHYEKQFDVVFSCNCLLPGGIALGRHKSYGAGVTQAQ
ncbi:MAG: hypothetical protein JNL57_00100 [Bacteroidetes bacterium]|nr:hypothetical protein [Bacteroidota bacterium]